MGYGCIEALLKMGVPIAALFTHEDDSREEIWWRSCADLARRRGVPVYTPERLDEPWLERVTGMRPAIIYSFYYRNLLPQALLRAASLGAYNLHGSLLPAYRGRAPVNWMLVNGEREAGVTLHHMVARADAGESGIADRAALAHCRAGARRARGRSPRRARALCGARPRPHQDRHAVQGAG